MSTEGGPVFVDVDANQQLPTFSQLITAEEAIELAQAGSRKKVKRLAADTSKETLEARKKEAELACTETKERPFRCDECKRFRCDTEERLIRHMRKHRGENQFQCYMCEYSTYNKAVFEEHVRVHQGIKPFKCSYCDYKSASKKNTKKHELIHRDDNPNKCKDCDFIGRNPQSYKHHRITAHTKKHKCKHCKIQFPNKEKLSSHYKSGRKCPKKKCEFKYCNSKTFYEHMIGVHGEEGEPYKRRGNAKTKERKDIFKCALCKWSSSIKPRILLHLIHHPNQKVDESVIDLTILRNCGIVE